MARKYLGMQIRLFVGTRANYLCEYCKIPNEYFASFVIDHFLPLSKLGTDELLNLVLACNPCNASKGDATNTIDPVSGTVVPLFNPRTQIWAEHFTWSDDFTLIVPTTITGRATLDRLNLNRSEHVNLRRVLTELGLHPPIG